MGKVIVLVLSVVCLAAQLAVAKEKHIKYTEKDLLRKSIVYDKNTPDVFYCPVSKPTGMDKMIVRSRALSKLCEHEGKPLPPHYKSDCYNDVDESNYACKEKYRIMNDRTKSTMALKGQAQTLTLDWKTPKTNIHCVTKDKEGFHMRLNPPGSDAPFNGQRLSRFMDMDDDMKRIKTKKRQ